MKPDLFRDMGITPEDRMLENVNKMFGLLRPNVPPRVTWEDLSGNDAQVITHAEHRREYPEEYEECCECGDEFLRERMTSVTVNDERYCCDYCMKHVANPGAR